MGQKPALAGLLAPFLLSTRQVTNQTQQASKPLAINKAIKFMSLFWLLAITQKVLGWFCFSFKSYVKKSQTAT